MSKPFLLPRWPAASQKILHLEFLSIKMGMTYLMKRQIETIEVVLWWSLHLHSRKKKLTKSEGRATEFSACCCCAGMWDLGLTLTCHTVSAMLARLSLKDPREERERRKREKKKRKREKRRQMHSSKISLACYYLVRFFGQGESGLES